MRRGQQTREGRDDPDVVVEGMPLWVEVKTWGARHSWPAHVEALHQAETAMAASEEPCRIPIAVIRESRRPAMVVLRLEAARWLVEGMPPWINVPTGPPIIMTWASLLVWLARL